MRASSPWGNEGFGRKVRRGRCKRPLFPGRRRRARDPVFGTAHPEPRLRPEHLFGVPRKVRAHSPATVAQLTAPPSLCLPPHPTHAGADTVSLPYRPNVGVALFNRAGLVFAGRSISSGPEIIEPGLEWQMPQ